MFRLAALQTASLTSGCPHTFFAGQYFEVTMHIHTIQLNIERIIGGTAHMDATEFGAYMSLIISCYQCRNKLPKDDKRLSRMARVSPHKWGKIKGVVLEKFDDKKTHFEQNFVKKDLLRIESLSKKNTANALKKNNTNEPVAERSHSQTQANTNNKELVTNNKDKNPPIPPKGESVSFSEMWEAFPRQRRGNKSKALAAYNSAVSRANVFEILEGVMKYAASDEVSRGFAKGCAAWLNDDRWANDYSTTAKPKEKTCYDIRDELLAEMKEEKPCQIEMN